MVAIAGFFLILLFIIISVIGLILLIAGVVLDVRWIINNRNQREVKTVHKVFAVILTISGVLMGIGPSAALGIVYLRQSIMDQNEIRNLPESDLVYVDNRDDLYADGFDYHGEHYVFARELISSTSYDSFTEKSVGAVIIRSDNSHRMIYGVDNLMDADIMYVEDCSKVCVKEMDVESIYDYYQNEAPLFAIIGNGTTNRVTHVDNIDAPQIRQIVKCIILYGSDTNPVDEVVPSEQRGRISFYSTDRMHMFMLNYTITSEGIVMSYDGKYYLLEGNETDYIMQLINSFLEDQSSN